MTIKATFDRGVFIPEKKTRIRNGQTGYLEILCIPAEVEEKIRRVEYKKYTLEQLKSMMGLHEKKSKKHAR